MFITLEGGEGVGKTTQAHRLVDHLNTVGKKARYTREPGGTPFGSAIRALILHPNGSLQALISDGLAATPGPAEEVLPVTEALLLSADRAQHVAQIRQWLDAGEIVVCDRYADATRAYQGAGRGVDCETVEALIRIATGGLEPDLTILLDLPVKYALGRKEANVTEDFFQLDLFVPFGWNRLDRESDKFHRRVREGYLRLAESDSQRWRVLRLTTSDTPEQVADRIWHLVRERLSLDDATPS